MAAVDPYAPCPCGSGQKFKWCCHKVEAQAERAHRLFENGQIEAAIQVLQEGLRKEPGNAWLLTRKAIYQVQLKQYDAAKESVGLVLRKNPRHLGALVLLTQLRLQTDGPLAGVAQLQQALASVDEVQRPGLAVLIRLIGMVLDRAGEYPSALRHLKLFGTLTGREDLSGPTIQAIERKPSVTPWLKNPEELAPPPPDLSDASRERFVQALTWAEQGLWSSAASAFEVLSTEPEAGAETERNLGLCRLWILDHDGAVSALRRAVDRLGTTVEAVDLEALAQQQQYDVSDSDDQVEHVELTWPLRNRERLLQTLRSDSMVEEEESGPLDPEDPDSPEVTSFTLLDRPKLESLSGRKVEDIPVVVGWVNVSQDSVWIETYDDGRLDALVERFTTLAEGSIAPAHPKTKVLDQISKSSLALTIEWRLPEGLDVEEQIRWQVEQTAWVVREVWPKTPMPYLKGRTPLEAGKAGDAVVPLRAALMQFQTPELSWHRLVDFSALRARLGIEPEPAIDPATVDIERLHIARLALVPADRLDDDRLARLFVRARQYGLVDAVDHAARALIDRPQLWEQVGTDALDLHVELALYSAARDRQAEALEWIRKGRQADPAHLRATNAPTWDMVEIRIKARTERPETWVPELAVVLERYTRDPGANRAIMVNLLEMGLVQAAPNPDQPDDILIDSRPLRMLLAEYGPRVTTASGGLGLSATKGEIWTPSSPTGGGGALWTPGSGAEGSPQGGEDKPKLIIPGR